MATPTQSIDSVAIAGTGLIGTSIGLALRERGVAVMGWDPNPATLEASAARGAVEPVAAVSHLFRAIPDLLVLAGPPHAVIETVASDAAAGYPGLVIDVAGVKTSIVERNRFRRFVGTHPMAGRETAGPAAASAGLFRGATWVITPEDHDSIDTALVLSFIDMLGGRPMTMTPTDHDTAVAAISHLPQLLASTLMNEAIERTQALDLVAGGFRDLTRVAASDAGMWLQILDENRAEVVSVLQEFITRLGDVSDAIETRDEDRLAKTLDEARNARRAMAASTSAVRVALADEPGELAKVGRAFEISGVDVRDLQLRHAPHGGGGVLTVAVRTDDVEAMVKAMSKVGLLVVE